MANVPHDRLAILREKVNQQQNTIAALKRDGHECADAERQLTHMLAELNAANDDRSSPQRMDKKGRPAEA